MNGLRIEPCAKRIRAFLGGHLVVDSTAAWLVWERPQYPAYYLPLVDLQAQLEPTGRVRAAVVGEGQLYDVRTAGGTAQAAALGHADCPVERLRGLVRLDWDAMDGWLEEDEPVYTHPRDPYTRLDILHSSRHVRVDLEGVRLADSRCPTILFETGLPPRYYLPMSDLRLDLLRPSATVTHCPYKGAASYWSAHLGTTVHGDIAWCYRAPLPESAKIAGLVAFWNERVDLVVD
jgi:uncharacterized protein (DUF427 family)